MSTRNESAARAIHASAPNHTRYEYRAHLWQHRAQAALEAADAHDAKHGIWRVSDLEGKIAGLAAWLMEADITDSLDVLGTLAKGDITAILGHIEATR